MSISEHLTAIKTTLPDHVTLVAVSKTKPAEDIMEAYNAGQRIFGENKIQEMAEKYQQLPKDIQWHMIGHVQRNKVKYMAAFVEMIHAVDSLRLLQEIDKQAKRHNRIIACLLQLKIAEEDSKFGMSLDEMTSLLHTKELQELQNISINGLMGMATFTENMSQVEREFKTLKTAFDTLNQIETLNLSLKTLSMGMSGDYKLAIDCGSTMIRIGSTIFGSRHYS